MAQASQEAPRKKVLSPVFARIPQSPTIIQNWRGFKVPEGGNFRPAFFEEVAARVRNNRSCIISIVGPAGEGKTYAGMRLGQIFDKKFSCQSIVLERDQFLFLIGADSPLKRGQVIIIDEAQYAAGSRRWYEQIQKDMMEAIESIRSQGYIIIIIALHLNLLDVIIRKYVLNFMIHIDERGSGTIYRLFTPKFTNKMYHPRVGGLRVMLPDFEKCAHPDCLRCKHRHKCMTIRAIYERKKRKFLDSKYKRSRERIEDRRRKEKHMPDTTLVKTLHEKKSEIIRTTHGRLDLTAIQVLLQEEHDVDVGYRSKIIRAKFEQTYPLLKIVKTG